MADGAYLPLVERPDIDAAINDWMGGVGGRPFFHIVGSPGSGKSVWSRLFIERAAPSTPNAGRNRIVASHACVHNDATTWSAARFLEAITNAMAASDEDFAEAIASSVRKLGRIDIRIRNAVTDSPGSLIIGINRPTINLGSMTAADVIGPLFVEPIRAVLSQPGPNAIILVDGLDEAPESSAPTGIADLLLSLPELPPRVKFVVTSRPGRALERRFDEAGSVRFDLDTESVAEPLKQFVELSLTDGAFQKRLDSVSRNDISAAILEKAAGNFLVARCALETLKANAGPIKRADLQRMPATLPGAYLQFLTRHRASTQLADNDRLLALLGVLSVAREPLTEADLAHASGFGASEVRRIVFALRPFLREAVTPERTKGWMIFHKSFAEFLGDEAKAEEFFRSAAESHSLLCRWGFSEEPWNRAAGYIRRNLVSHVLGNGGKDVGQQLDRLISADFLRPRRSGDLGGDVVHDLKSCLVWAKCKQDIARLCIFGTIQALWRDREAAASAANSAAVLAALGDTERAIALALVPVEKGEVWDSTLIKRSVFARALGEMRRKDIAADFLEQIEDPAERTEVARVIIESSAKVGDAAGILVIQQITPDVLQGAGRQLTAETCRFLAAHEETWPLALQAASQSPSHLAALAVGRATCDLQAALKLVARLDSFTADLGGERLSIDRDHILLRALAAHVQARPEAAQLAMNIARETVGEYWSYSAGLRLVSALAPISTDLAFKAVDRLAGIDSGLSAAFAALNIVAANPELRDTVKKLIPDRDHAWAWSPWSSRLVDILPALELSNLQAFGRSDLFDLIALTSNTLLDAIEDPENEHPEFKRDGGPLVGRFLALAGEPALARLAAVVNGAWRNDGGAAFVVDGVAEGLASISTAGLQRARAANLFPNLEAHRPSVAAARVLARRDQQAAVELLESISPRFLLTRAEMAAAIAGAIPLGNEVILRRCLAAIDVYVESDFFAEAVASIQAAISAEDTDPQEARLLKARKLIAEGDRSSLQAAITLLQTLDAYTHRKVDGKTLRSRDMLLQAAGALRKHEPDTALRIALALAPSDDVDLVRPYARIWLDSIGAKNSTDAITSIRNLFDEQNLMPNKLVMLATVLALELPDDSAQATISHFENIEYGIVAGTMRIIRISLVDLEVAIRQFPEVLDSIGNPVPSILLPIASYLLSRRAARSPVCALEAIKLLDVGTLHTRTLYNAIANGCPINDCQSYIAELVNIERRGDASFWNGATIIADTKRIFSKRLAPIDRQAAYDMARSIKDSSWHDQAIEELLDIGLMGKPLALEEAGWWLEVANSCQEEENRQDALQQYLDYLSRSRGPTDYTYFSSVIAGLALGPRQSFLKSLRTVVSCVLRVAPDTRLPIEALPERAREILAT